MTDLLTHAATEALRTTLTHAWGPVEPFAAETDDGKHYIGFAGDQPPVASVEHYGAGWAVLDGRGRVVTYGPTPADAMQRAADPALWLEPVERRRPGRIEYTSPALIALLRGAPRP